VENGDLTRPPSSSGVFGDDTNNGHGPEFNVLIIALRDYLSTKYTCSIFPEADYEQFVIGTDELTCPTSGREVLEGTEEHIDCSVVYYQYSGNGNAETMKDPFVTWSNDAGEDLTGLQHGNVSNLQSGRRFVQTMNITLQAEHDGMTFTCDVGFPQTDYSANCTTFYNVLHGVSRTNVTSHEPDENGVYHVNVGDTVTCDSNGRPAPYQIRWLLTDTSMEVSDSADYKITDEFLTQTQPVGFTCEARNRVNNAEHSASGNFSLYIEHGANVKPSTAGVEAWVIAVAVVVPVVVITLLVVAGFYLYKRHQAKKKPPPNTRSTTSPVIYSSVRTQDPAPYTAQSVRSTNSPNYGPPIPRTVTPMGPALGTDSPGGHGDLGVRYYTGSNQALNPTAPSPMPSTQQRPAYPYNPRNGSVNMNPNPNVRPPSGPPPGQQPTYPYTGTAASNRSASVASTASRASYNAQSPVPPPFVAPSNQRSVHGSIDGSEV